MTVRVLLADRETPAQRYGATLVFFADRDKTEGYGEAMRGALIHGSCYGREQLVLLAWAVFGTVLTARTFKWE